MHACIAVHQSAEFTPVELMSWPTSIINFKEAVWEKQGLLRWSNRMMGPYAMATIMTTIVITVMVAGRHLTFVWDWQVSHLLVNYSGRNPNNAF